MHVEGAGRYYLLYLAQPRFVYLIPPVNYYKHVKFLLQFVVDFYVSMILRHEYKL